MRNAFAFPFHSPSLLFSFPNALWIQAAEGTFGKLVIKGKRLKVMWGKAQGSAPTPGHSSDAKLTPVPGLPPAREFSDCMIVWCVVVLPRYKEICITIHTGLYHDIFCIMI